MGKMDAIRRSLKRHSWATNLTINILLALLCVFSYVFLIALFLSQGLSIASFKNVDESSISPTAIIPVFGVILTGATSALLTRSVEHGLWDSLLQKEGYPTTEKQYTANEIERRAQWSVSPFARLLYTLNGQSWLLRTSGFLLFGTALLNPVLLYGVSPQVHAETETVTTAQSQPTFSGFVPYYDLNEEQDNIMILASLASRYNIIAPASSACTDPSCSVTANATALQAECMASSNWVANSDNEGRRRALDELYCNTWGRNTCVTLYEVISYNFTSGFSDGCFEAYGGDPTADGTDTLECPPGDFAVITGAWSVSAVATEEARDKMGITTDDLLGKGVTFHQVHCRISHGSVEMKQSGDSAPSFDRASFTKSTASIPHDVEEPVESSTDEDVIFLGPEENLAYSWQKDYLMTQYESWIRTPYKFQYSLIKPPNQTERAGPDGNPLPPVILSPRTAVVNGDSRFVNSSQSVATILEEDFDMATRLAFARAPAAASRTITTTRDINVWAYDGRVLVILAAPLLATIFVLCVYWRVHSDDVVVGYNPLEIARRADEIIIPQTTEDPSGDGEQSEATTRKGAYSSIESRQASSEEEGLQRGGEVAAPSVVPKPGARVSLAKQGDEFSALMTGREERGSGDAAVGHSTS